MSKKLIVLLAIGLIGLVSSLAAVILLFPVIEKEKNMILINEEKKEIIILPQPKFESDVSIEEAILERRSVREYKDESLNLQEVSQLLWAAQGITVRPDGRKGRTAPSAGALYPLEVYLTVKNVDGLEPGVYRFIPEGHKLEKIFEGDIQAELSAAALGQPWVAAAPINIIIGAVYERTTVEYGERGIRYVHMEVGHVGQNISLQVISLDLGTVVVGAFDDERVKRILNLPLGVKPLYIMPVGRPN